MSSENIDIGNNICITPLQNNLKSNINNQKMCDFVTTRHKRCKNKSKINGKCTFHNNRLNHIISNPNICRKLIFENCSGYNMKGQIVEKCTENGIHVSNDKYYCDSHFKSYKLEKPDECAICTEQILETQDVPLHCGHWFHLNCLKLATKMECPMCRTQFDNNEIERLIEMSFIRCYNNNETFILRVPKDIVHNVNYGISFIELIYLEIAILYEKLNLNYTHEKVNKIMLNIFKNNEYFELSKNVYDMFIPIYENGNAIMYIVKEHINFEEDNYYTLNYDRFLYIIENMYNSIN
jgi:hypothetical protein